MTLNRDGTYSRISATSSPKARSVPPQAGQLQGASCTTVSRGRLSGSARRAGLSLAVVGAARHGDRYHDLACARLQFFETQLELGDGLIDLCGVQDFE